MSKPPQGTTGSNADPTQLMDILRDRFANNKPRHRGLFWSDIEARLSSRSDKLRSLQEMERTGGEPDVVGRDKKTGEYIFMDCSPETPLGRRNVCYDRAGQIEREKEGINPSGNALDMAADMGVELLTEQDYRQLQKLGDFDTKTSSWIVTPAAIRDRGGALFADRRYGEVFIYHNGAGAFYRVRGFRGRLLA